MAQDLTSLLEEFEALKRSVRRIRRLILIGLAAVAGLAVMGQASGYRIPSVIEVERVIVKRGNEKVAEFGLLGPGNVGFELYGNERSGYAMVAVRDSGSSEILLSGPLKPGGVGQSLSLHVIGNISSVSLGEASGSGLTLLDAGGEPSISLLGSDKKTRAEIVVGTDGPYVRLTDDKGKSRAVLGYVGVETIRTGYIEKRPPSSLVLFDKTGKVLWRAP